MIVTVDNLLVILHWLLVRYVHVWTIKLDNSYMVIFIFSCIIVTIHISVEYHYQVIYYNMRHPLDIQFECHKYYPTRNPQEGFIFTC